MRDHVVKETPGIKRLVFVFAFVSFFFFLCFCSRQTLGDVIWRRCIFTLAGVFALSIGYHKAIDGIPSSLCFLVAVLSIECQRTEKGTRDSPESTWARPTGLRLGLARQSLPRAWKVANGVAIPKPGRKVLKYRNGREAKKGGEES